MIFANGRVLIEKLPFYLFAVLKSMPQKADITLILLAVILVAACSGQLCGQAVDVAIKAVPQTEYVEVTGRFADGGKDVRNLAFEREFAGVAGLGERISDVSLSAADGRKIEVKAFAPGEFAAAEPIAGFSYRVRLSPPKLAGQAHVSWLKDGRGIIFLGDLLPLPLGSGDPSARVTMSGFAGVGPPAGCIADVKDAAFLCADRSNGVIPISTGSRDVEAGNGRLLLRIEGKWLFDDEPAANEFDDVFRHYEHAFGGTPDCKPTVTIMRFAETAPHSVWEADTRGCSIVILSSDTPFRSQSLQQLGNLFRHEAFHLWFPNGVKLSGRYDWFYEGMALYMSKKAGLSLNRIRFDDLLSSLSTAIAFDRTAPKGLSLASATDSRWENSTTLYARGLLAAFILDVELLKRSKGKHSVESVLRKLFADHGSRNAVKADATTAILEAFSAFDDTGRLAESLLNRPEPLDLTNTLENSGMEFSSRALVVRRDPSGREKAILDKLGYNNWRKLSSR
ncbi:MAG: hypothetical protein UZ17_ACD001000905 [Acidobacteria bacterium OLB17]|nr:MAG: hypothetical protein UZ17_ACD001000905 [Acidobacteria bacterium OLB17]